ncbi:MAG: sigma 54-interacting transcriptional regulator [Deltaproteobacteria bacterium]|nr:sigma 54-interacting transcriptional regulator [Deltaproteobacteria bacterium]
MALDTEPLDRLLDQLGPRAAFEVLSDLLPEAAVFVVDGDRNVVHWSQGATQMLGTSADEAVGQLCLSSIRCRQCMLGCGIAKYGHVDGFAIDLYRADESWIPTRKYARGFFDEKGEFIGGIEVLVAQGGAQPEEGDFDDGFQLPSDAEAFQGMISRDPEMLRAFQTVRRVAETDATVLLQGETGTGKELIARAVHAESRRRNQPFIGVNCGALTPTLVESELFGHRRGAFTGAVGERRGLFEQAEGGTLFLDEIAELPLEMQAKLLRVLEEHRVTPLGAEKEVEVDVRVITATHQMLPSEVDAGRFREDLMYRLRVVPIFIPPLRDRRGDVELLLHWVIAEFNERGPRHISSTAPDAMRALLDYRWPGNVRELRNVLQYGFAVGRGPELALDELPPELRVASSTLESDRRAPILESTGERERIREALQLAQGRVNEAAARLGMSRSTFWRKRRKLGV